MSIPPANITPALTSDAPRCVWLLLNGPLDPEAVASQLAQETGVLPRYAFTNHPGEIVVQGTHSQLAGLQLRPEVLRIEPTRLPPILLTSDQTPPLAEAA